MRTGNAFWSVTFAADPAPLCRITLLDAGEEAVAELRVPDWPWEESAAVPLEAMSLFRTAVESIPEQLADGPMDPSLTAPSDAASLRIEISSEVDGRRSEARSLVMAPQELPAAQASFLAALLPALRAALVAGRSQRMLDLLAAWVFRAPAASPRR